MMSVRLSAATGSICREMTSMRVLRISSTCSHTISKRGGDSVRTRRRGFCPIVLGTGQWKPQRSEEHTSELQSLMRISYAVFCLKKKIIYYDPIKKEEHI